MSVTLEHGSTLEQKAPVRETPRARLYFWVVGSTTSLCVAVLFFVHWREVPALAPLLITFVVSTMVADLRPVNVWKSANLSMSLPVTLAAAMVLPPWAAGSVAFLGAFDVREFTGQVSLPRALFNRGQIAVSVMSAGIAFAALGGSLNRWPAAIALAFICLCVDDFVNLALLSLPLGDIWDVPPTSVVGHVLGEDPLVHLSSFAALGMLSLPLALLVVTQGPWGLAVSILPFVLGRRLFEGSNRIRDYGAKLEAKNIALTRAINDLARERREERLVIAGELHDEVLPPLFQVHLMGQVLRQDLSRGRLLELDDDLPKLLEATEAAQSAIRNLVRDLRQSPLGPGGLFPTVRLLTSELESAGSTRIDLELEECETSALTQLLAYQVVREALNNACRHSRCGRALVRVWPDGDVLRLVVSDDGVGFIPWMVDSSEHFGLQLISERVEAGGGRVVIQSLLGQGTTVAASLPRLDRDL